MGPEIAHAAAAGDETFPGTDLTAPYFTAVRDALDHWQRGAPPPIGVHDCARVVRLIDQAYARGGDRVCGAVGLNGAFTDGEA